MKLLNEIKIGMASDHAGVELKQYLLDFLKEKGCEVSDFGTNSTESCDYPDFAHPLAEAVEQNKCDYGIAICGSGNGISMTLNKHQQVRAALCWDTPLAELARQHNDANILSLPARFISTEKAVEMVLAFFSTDFEGGRHQNRVDKIAVK